MIMVTMAIAAIALSSCKEKTTYAPPWLETDSTETETTDNVITMTTSELEKAEAQAEKAAARRAEGEAGLKNTYYSHRFSIGYPERLKERFSDETTFTAETDDKDSRMDVTFERDGQFSDLNECALTLKEKGSEDEFFESAKINGNVMTMKSTHLGETCMYFVVKKDAVTGVIGKYYFSSSKSAEYEKYFPSIVQSIVIK